MVDEDHNITVVSKSLLGSKAKQSKASRFMF